jgi:hypothetical protein
LQRRTEFVRQRFELRRVTRRGDHAMTSRHQQAADRRADAADCSGNQNACDIVCCRHRLYERFSMSLILCELCAPVNLSLLITPIGDRIGN